MKRGSETLDPYSPSGEGLPRRPVVPVVHPLVRMFRVVATDIERIRELAEQGSVLVAALEAELLKHPQRTLDTSHEIHGGMYARTVLIPAGTLLTGAMTAVDNICVIVGDITVTTDEGPRRIVGHHVLPAARGTKRMGYAHSDTWWTMVMPTSADTVDGAEDAMTPESDRLQSRSFVARARADYLDWLSGCGIPQSVINAAMEQTSDLTLTTECFGSIYLASSEIHGTGVFASRTITAGQPIAPGRIDGKRCVAGRWTNHSHLPNAHFVAVDDDMVLVALCDVDPGDEVTVDYRVAQERNRYMKGDA